MKRNNRSILPFILLNVVISAATTLLVLVIWDSSRQASVPALLPPIATPAANLNLPTPEPATTPTLPPADVVLIEISSVESPGDLARETVWLKRTGSSRLDLTGWTLTDEDGHVFIFPAFAFYEGAIQVNTRSGQSSSIARFWGQNQAVWQSGETVTLLDYNGGVRATYVIP